MNEARLNYLAALLVAACATSNAPSDTAPTSTLAPGPTAMQPSPSTSNPSASSPSVPPGPTPPPVAPSSVPSNGETASSATGDSSQPDPAESSQGTQTDAASSAPASERYSSSESSAPQVTVPTTESTTAPPPTPTFHVFLLLGQSNMAGYPKAEAADRVEDPRVRVLGFDACAETGREEGRWDIAAPPLHECWNGAIGPGDHFAKTVIQSLPDGDTIGLVPCAISGEKIETFLKNGGSKYEWLISRAQAALDEGGVIDGILFHQGESNTGDPNWPGKVKTLVTDLRADLGIGNAPFLAGELAPTGNSASHNTLVNQLPSLIDNAFVVSAQGLAIDPQDTQWNLHFDHDSVVTFGERYAATMLEALGW